MNANPPYTNTNNKRPAAPINAAYARPGQIDQIDQRNGPSRPAPACGPDNGYQGLKAPNGPDQQLNGPAGPLGNREDISSNGLFLAQNGLSSAPIADYLHNTRPRRSLAKSHEIRAGRYGLRAYAQKLLIHAGMPGSRGSRWHGTRTCGAIRHKNVSHASIWVSGPDAAPSASMRGIQTCDNVFACPVCAARIASERGNEISRALAWADENGYEPIMLTLTAGHGKHYGGPVDTTDLKAFRAAFQRAYQYFASGRVWLDLIDLIGTRFKGPNGNVTATIAAREVTHGGQHGAHYHMHILLFVRLHPDIVTGLKAGRKRAKRARTAYMANTMSLIDQALRPRWMKALAREGLTARPDIALHLRAGDKAAARYLSKIASSGGLNDDNQAVAGPDTAFQTHGDADQDEGRAHFEYELPGAINKGFDDDEEGLTVWQVLRAAHDNRGSVDENKYARLYAAHVAALSGTNWITWGHAFKALIGLDELADDELADDADQPDQMMHLIDLDDLQMQALRATRTRGSFRALIDLAAATRDSDTVAAWLADLADLVGRWNDARQAVIDRHDAAYWSGILSGDDLTHIRAQIDQLMTLGILIDDDNPLADDRPPDNRYQARPGPAPGAGRSDRSGYGPDDDTEEFPHVPGHRLY